MYIYKCNFYLRMIWTKKTIILKTFWNFVHCTTLSLLQHQESILCAAWRSSALNHRMCSWCRLFVKSQMLVSPCSSYTTIWWKASYWVLYILVTSILHIYSIIYKRHFPPLYTHRNKENHMTKLKLIKGHSAHTTQFK